ncbi:MAG: hypothetical protein JWQ76_5227 [Ramlibacter sp.]|nr:hypothetical protein [Ramlibacter sp.]
MPSLPYANRAFQLALAVAAVAIFWLAASAHLERTCTLLDTPYLPLCSASTPSVTASAEELRRRIARNPGDSDAWTKLMVLQPGVRNDALLRGATQLAPNNPNVLRSRAGRALERRDMPAAVALLLEMVRYRNSGEAAQVLAQMMASAEGAALLRPQLADAKEWLPQVLASTAAQKLPLGRPLPLVLEAIEKDSFPPEAQRSYMRSLKSGGYWLDAYGLWLAQHKQELPLLYNASFDEAFEPDGFDWEFPVVARSRAGSLMDQPAVARRGRVLEIEFTGRHLARPMAGQYVFVAPGSYRFRGDYMGAKFRSQEGLVWAVRCMNGGNGAVARSQPLQDTGTVWRSFELLFNVPDNCGPVVSIQLDVAADFEAAVGLRGTMSFDSLSLVRAPH